MKSGGLFVWSHSGAMAPEWVPQSPVFIHATSAPGFFALSFIYFSKYLIYCNYYFQLHLTCLSIAEPFQSNYVVCVDPQRFQMLEMKPLWQTVLYSDKWLLRCAGRAEGKLDSRLITTHTWPQHVVNVLISKLSTADEWVHKQTV